MTQGPVFWFTSRLCGNGRLSTETRDTVYLSVGTQRYLQSASVSPRSTRWFYSDVWEKINCLDIDFPCFKFPLCLLYFSHPLCHSSFPRSVGLFLFLTCSLSLSFFSFHQLPLALSLLSVRSFLSLFVWRLLMEQNWVLCEGIHPGVFSAPINLLKQITFNSFCEVWFLFIWGMFVASLVKTGDFRCCRWKNRNAWKREFPQLYEKPRSDNQRNKNRSGGWAPDLGFLHLIRWYRKNKWVEEENRKSVFYQAPTSTRTMAIEISDKNALKITSFFGTSDSWQPVAQE